MQNFRNPDHIPCNYSPLLVIKGIHMQTDPHAFSDEANTGRRYPYFCIQAGVRRKPGYFFSLIEKCARIKALHQLQTSTRRRPDRINFFFLTKSSFFRFRSEEHTSEL